MSQCNCCGGHQLQDHVGCCESGFYVEACSCERGHAKSIADLEVQLAEARELLLSSAPDARVEMFPDLRDWWGRRRDAWLAKAGGR